MATKPDAKPAPAAPEKEKSAESAPAPAPAPAGKGAALKAWLPVLAAAVLAPALSFALAQFVLLPRLQAKLSATAAPGEHVAGEEAPAAEPAKSGEKKGHGDKEGAAIGNYEFTNVVVNLAGTMGTRYLKTSFIVTGVKNAPTKGVFEEDKAKLTDITLNVLSSLSLADLEEPGSKNVLREKLVAAYNQALGKRLVEQVYFSDFVIQ